MTISLIFYEKVSKLFAFCQNMQETENVLSEMCHDRDEPTEEECDEAADTHFLPPFQPPNGGGARLTMSSSISLLSRYQHVTIDIDI